VGQLPKLEFSVERRVAAARSLTQRLKGLPGIETPFEQPGSLHTYWKYCLRVDANVIPGGSDALGEELKARQISCAPRYVQKPAFMCRVFQEQKTFGNSRYPFTLARPEVLQYDPKRFPLTMQALESVLVLPWNENYREEHLDYIADNIQESIVQLCN